MCTTSPWAMPAATQASTVQPMSARTSPAKVAGPSSRLGESADGEVHRRLPHHPPVVHDAEQQVRQHQADRRLGGGTWSSGISSRREPANTNWCWLRPRRLSVQSPQSAEAAANQERRLLQQPLLSRITCGLANNDSDAQKTADPERLRGDGHHKRT